MAQTRLCVLVPALACLGLAAMSGRAPARQRAPVPEYESDAAVVELSFDYVEHQILVRGAVESRGGLVFLVDTGATAPVLESDLGPLGDHLGNTTFQEAEGETGAESVRLNLIEVGETTARARVRNLPALRADLRQLSRVLRRRLDGILGISFLAGFVTEIDYANHKIRLRRPEEFSLARRQPDAMRSFLFALHPTDPRQGTPCLLLTGLLAGKTPCDFLLDTGFGGYLSVPQKLATESGLLQSETPRVSSTAFSVSRRFRSEKIRAGVLRVGELDVSGRVIQVDDRNRNTLARAGIVGNQLLQNYSVILDYPRRRLWLERATGREEPDEAERPSPGVSLRVAGRQLIVDRVQRSSPAHRAGIRPGDILLTVNGKPAYGARVEAIMAILRTSGMSVALALERGIDPNLGTPGGSYRCTLRPLSPLEWQFSPPLP